MNVGKATIKDGKVVSTSRELTYYLDPQTHEKLVQWENPWTGEKLSGMFALFITLYPESN